MAVASPLVECVANVSEGRDDVVLAALAAALTSVPGCHLIHQDTGAGAHRTVFTFAGRPDAVFAAAYRLYETALALIDMRRHSGEHPRLGAVDVCPFVAIRDVGERDILARTRVLGEELGRRLGIPTLLYERSATAEYRRNLAAVRRGEFEGLTDKLRDPAWRPDYGPAAPHPTFGATVLGVRDFLVAWNINLAPGADLAVVRAIAGRLRASGRGGRPGLFPGLKAIGWAIPEFGRCQVSCNVVDVRAVNLAAVYDAAAELAAGYGTSVTGSELIGLVPEFVLARAGGDEGRPRERVAAAISRLGLNDLAPFVAEERILEYVLAGRT